MILRFVEFNLKLYFLTYRTDYFISIKAFEIFKNSYEENFQIKINKINDTINLIIGTKSLDIKIFFH